MKIRLECTYQTPGKAEIHFRSEEKSIGEVLLIADDLEKTKRAKKIEFLDQHDSMWKRKDLEKYRKQLETEPHDVSVYFDGGFDLNDRLSGLGCVIYYKQNGKAMRRRRSARIEQLGSNNEAEYAALHLAVQELGNLGAQHLPVTFYGDSRVVIHQMEGDWACVEEELNRWADRIDADLETAGITPSYQLLSRKDNKEADRLASEALSGKEISSTSEIR
ncbi:UNVERIFIED_CONTAM: reverse transcriptase-like protein [Halobacillus marinus]|uniref:reverse transcriptase-like protein n=1 Tax=Halobacillus sp. KGW1 TaxID=1793726 RepID=UPI000781E98B|nr:reverse transcriptase-like protein [Halobacillus sp. KGW1]